MSTKAALLVLTLAAPASAEAPLSAIDWLGQDRAEPAIAPPAGTTEARAHDTQPPQQPRRIDEPPVTSDATAPSVREQSLGEPVAGAAGLLPMSVTGLPRSMWQGSDPGRLVRLIEDADPAVPALSALLNTLMLAEADPPEDGGRLLAARVRRLIEDGALDAAEALLDRAGPARPALFEAWFDVALLGGSEDRPCAALTENPALTRDVGPRIFCAAREGDWPRAALALESARALGEVSGREADLLERFLSPEIAESLPSLPPATEPTPLTYVLAEAVGEPVPTSALPRAFAVADLSGEHGWKAQIESAERLARAGALSDNRLLGIYTMREPAASGGVWERVEAVQELDAAISRDDAKATAEALRTAWPMMVEAGLAVPVAQIFGPDLAAMDLDGAAARYAEHVALLSEEYEALAPPIDDGPAELRFLGAVARGEAPPVIPSDLPHAAAIGRAFGSAARGDTDLLALSGEDRLGEAILRTIDRFGTGAAGNGDDLTEALATLRALGLEDTARRAALQLAILTEDTLR
ncbi:hypothetical protein SAMN05444413_103100 [Roseivivax marinus]|uniref:hypothetical protein n=1 Tax=Roseivivax marinus TaxID=1379903 RepID=UPI0008C3B587|nr:hypothetical protein [Roseivivax marinus]SEK72752.1 hypothetical protein SAMN05444413_103100 [Roseivivax marinus]